MKAQFKHAFMAGLYVRGGVFAVIFVMNLAFITLGSLNLLTPAAHVTAVSLGGIAIAVMMAANIIGDVAVARRMFAAPGAYLHALTPVPRWKTLLASVLAMAVMDFVTMAAVIAGEVWLSLNLAGRGIWRIIWNAVRANASDLPYVLFFILLLIAGYLLIMTIIMFCVTAEMSVFYKMRASGLITFLLACGCFYAASLLQLILAPFGSVERYGVLITLYLPFRGAVPPLYILLVLMEAAALFVLTSKFMERKMNI